MLEQAAQAPTRREDLLASHHARALSGWQTDGAADSDFAGRHVAEPSRARVGSCGI